MTDCATQAWLGDSSGIMPVSLHTYPILGSPLAVLDYAEAIAIAREWSESESVFAIAAANTHVVSLARHDPVFRDALEKFDLLLPDGMPLVWCLNRALPPEERLRDRVYGPTFMLRFLEASSHDSGARHFLLGGPQLLLDQLAQQLVRQMPLLQIAGTYVPPFGEWDDAEDLKIIRAIAGSRARYIWVGLGCPKQELWIARNRHRLPHGVYFAVGAAFAFHAGQVKQAPLWLQDRGFEWLYRLWSEPRRLAKRYLRYNTLFLYYLLRDRISR
ncbi:MAG: WecB/TagA/CpsF family glycosyltransferase [Verrucomicrobiota bacterium]|nr:WecB/TagA/CpsF family glycosyltransferase [Verrucomicrobiota bacterium]